MKDGVIFHFENIEDVEDMTDAELGQFFRAWIAYAKDGESPDFADKAMHAAWKPVRRRIDDDDKRYEERCEKNRAAINKRWGSTSDTNVFCEDTKNTNVKNVSKKNTKDTNTNTNTDSDSESDKEIDNARAREDIPYGEIVEYLNEKTGTKYKPSTKSMRRCIEARWREKFRLEDFKKVIDIKCSEWKGDEKMQKYLRPETLFSTKFESYLNQGRLPPTRAKPKNQFNNYQQREDDLDDLQRKLNKRFAEITEGT